MTTLQLHTITVDVTPSHGGAVMVDTWGNTCTTILDGRIDQGVKDWVSAAHPSVPLESVFWINSLRYADVRYLVSIRITGRKVVGAPSHRRGSYARIAIEFLHDGEPNSITSGFLRV